MGVGGGGGTVMSQRELPCVSFFFPVIKSRFVLLFFFFFLVHFNKVQCRVRRMVKQMGYYLLQSFQRRAGQAGGVTVSQCISSAGFSHLHQDLSYPL